MKDMIRNVIREKPLLVVGLCGVTLLVVGLLIYAMYFRPIPIPIRGTLGPEMMTGYMHPPEPAFDTHSWPATMPVYRITGYIDFDFWQPSDERLAFDEETDKGRSGPDDPEVKEMLQVTREYLATRHLPIPKDHKRLTPDFDLIPMGGARPYSICERQDLDDEKYFVTPSSFMVWAAHKRSDPKPQKTKILQNGLYEWAWVEKVGEVPLSGPRDAYKNLIEHGRVITQPYRGWYADDVGDAALRQLPFQSIGLGYGYDAGEVVNGTQKYLIPIWIFYSLDDNYKPEDPHFDPPFRVMDSYVVSAVDSDKPTSHAGHPEAYTWNPEIHPGFVKNDRFDALKNIGPNYWIQNDMHPEEARVNWHLPPARGNEDSGLETVPELGLKDNMGPVLTLPSIEKAIFKIRHHPTPPPTQTIPETPTPVWSTVKTVAPPCTCSGGACV